MRAIRKEEEIVIEQDTIRLLRECDAGIEMGTSSIDDVLEATKDKRLRQILQHCRDEHTALKLELEELLLRFQDEGKPSMCGPISEATKATRQRPHRRILRRCAFVCHTASNEKFAGCIDKSCVL